MFELILAFVAGMIVMDYMWARKLGITNVVFNRVKQRFARIFRKEAV